MAGNTKRKIEDPVPERRSSRTSAASSSSRSTSSSSSSSTTPIRSSTRVAAKSTPPSAKGKAKVRDQEEETNTLKANKTIIKNKTVGKKDDKFSRELSDFDSLLASVTKDNEYHEVESFEEEATEEDEDILKQVDSIEDDQFDVKEEKINTFFTNWKALPAITKPNPKNDVFLKLGVETNDYVELLTSGWILSVFDSSKVSLLLPWLYETAVYSTDLKIADSAFKNLVALLTGSLDHMHISASYHHNLLLKLDSDSSNAPDYFTCGLFLDTFRNFGLVLPTLLPLPREPDSKKSIARSHSIKEFPLFNFQIALGIMGICFAKWPTLMSAEELQTSAQVLCYLLIDPTVSKCSLQVSNCLCQLLRCVPDDEWESESKEIARKLVNMETKNYRVTLANRIPIGDRGRKLQITMAGLLLCELLKVSEEEWASKTDTIDILLLFFSKVSITRSTDPEYYTNLLTYLSLMDLALDKADIVRHPKKAQNLKAKFQFAKDKIATLTHLSILLTKEQLSKFVTLFIVFLPQKSIIDNTFTRPTSKSSKLNPAKKQKSAMSSKQQAIDSFLISKPPSSSLPETAPSSPPSSSLTEASSSSSTSSSPNTEDALKPLF